jgi:hypothetical protein
VRRRTSALVLTPVSGYTPTTGDAFTILTYVAPTTATSPGFSLSYDDVNGILTVTAL